MRSLGAWILKPMPREAMACSLANQGLLTKQAKGAGAILELPGPKSEEVSWARPDLLVSARVDGRGYRISRLPCHGRARLRVAGIEFRLTSVRRRI